MNKINIIVLLISTLIIIMTSCINFNSNSELNQSDTITFKKLSKLDSIIIHEDNFPDYSIACSVNITMPIDKKLRKQFIKSVLAFDSDSLQNNELLTQYLSTQFDGLGLKNIEKTEDAYNDEIDCEIEKCHNYLIEIIIIPTYNKNNILTFKKEERTIRDGKLAMLTSNYFTFNASTSEPIYMNNIFDENNISEITQMLKEQLKRQLKINDENVIYEMGYFNLDNVVANNNFEITNEGIAWTYLPYEIACYSIGETRIILPYSLISQYISDKSILSQFK